MKTILFVDDETQVLDELASWFKQHKSTWNMHFLNSSPEAITFIEQHTVDCVVSDMNMPDINGAALLSVVAHKQPNAVRIALSGNADAELTLESLHATHRFISKTDSLDRVNDAIERAFELRERIHDPELRSLITGITSLPVLPEIYDRLMLELASDDFSIGIVSRIIESDISLSATLLKIVNSSYYGLVQHVESVAHAVSLLGIEDVKNILLSEKIICQFKQYSPGAKRVSELNVEASIRGVLANRFARLAALPKRQIDHSQMSGMLSSLGELVVETRMIEKEAMESRQYHNDLIGSSILGLWSLPDTIVEAVLNQSGLAPCGQASPLHVLHAIRQLEQAFKENDYSINEQFTAKTALSNCQLDSELQEMWFDCFCDYQLDLKQAA